MNLANANAELICPITLAIPTDPVLLKVDGRIYERKALNDWLNNNNVSPYNRQTCSPADILECIPIRNLCARLNNNEEPLEDASKEDIKNTGDIYCLPIAYRRDINKLLFSISCVNKPNLIKTPKDLSWSDIEVCIDNSYSTGNAVEERNDSGCKTESNYCINDLIRHTSKAIVEAIKDTGSRVGFTTFDNNVKNISDLTEINSKNKNSVLEKINDIVPCGGTHIWKGCRNSIQRLLTRKDKTRNPAVLLLTDGQPTEGPNKPENEAIARLLDSPPSEWKCKAQGRIPIYSMGFGYSLKRDLMYDIAKYTGGVNSSIPGPEMMTTVFGSAIANILNTRCYSMKLHLFFPDINEWEIGRHGVFDELIDTDFIVKNVTHVSNKTHEIQILVGCLQFHQSRELAINIKPLTENASFNYWISYYQGDELCGTKSNSTVISEINSIGDSNVINTDYHLIREYSCKLLKLMIEDRNRGILPNCKMRYDWFLDRIRKLNHISPEIEYLKDTWTDQVRLGLVSTDKKHADYWERWGWIYIDQLRSALANQCSTNFKDIALKPFISSIVSETSDLVSEVFDDLPNTEPTASKYSYNRYSNSRSTTTARTSTVYSYNQSCANTSCFTGDTLVEKNTGSISTIKSLCKISEIVPGDSITGAIFDTNGKQLSDNHSFKVLAVLVTEIPCGNLNLVELYPGCTATMWHPMLNTELDIGWNPASTYVNYKREPCNSVFSLVLEFGAMIAFKNYYGATLGHGVENCNGLAHPFWGTEKIIQSIKKLPNYPYVKIHPSMIQRNGEQYDWGREVSDIC